MKITWRDEDGDDVSIESNEELLIALHEMKGPLYKLSVTACHQDELLKLTGAPKVKNFIEPQCFVLASEIKSAPKNSNETSKGILSYF